MNDEPFLSRWSRRKNEAKTASEAGTAGPTADDVPVTTGTQVESAPAPEPLPPVESLTPDSDFAAFMKPEVDPALKRDAFKKLIADPRYNVMDGLDVYIDDYSKPDPLPEGWLEKMNQVKHLGIFREEVPEPTAEAVPQPGAATPETMLAEPAAFPEAAVALDTLDDGNLPVPVPEKPQLPEGS